MRITYDPEGDILYVELRQDVRAYDNVDIEPGVSVDLDEVGHIIGLELMDASERLGSPPTMVELSWLTGPEGKVSRKQRTSPVAKRNRPSKEKQHA